MDQLTDLPDYLRTRYDERDIQIGRLAEDDSDDTAEIKHEVAILDSLYQLLDLHTQASSTVGPYCSACSPSGNKHRWPCTTLRIIALPYAARDDFNTELWSL